MPTKKSTKKETKPVKVEAKKITPELICEVLQGKWGDEKDRSAKLKAAGYAPSVVTKKIKALQAIFDKIGPEVIEAGDYLLCLYFFYPHEKK